MTTGKMHKPQPVPPAEKIAWLAKFYLGIETLDMRNSDRLDFHEVAVWNVKTALEAAYKAGQENRQTPLNLSDPKRCEDCSHHAHKGNCPCCSKGEMCNPHPKGTILPGWKKL